MNPTPYTLNTDSDDRQRISANASGRQAPADFLDVVASLDESHFGRHVPRRVLTYAAC